jgi:hypothetical protein
MKQYEVSKCVLFLYRLRKFVNFDASVLAVASVFVAGQPRNLNLVTSPRDHKPQPPRHISSTP